MRYVQLRAFHYVALHGGFSRAAEALGITQPAISDQVRNLEQHYDVLLFNRHKKQITLTVFGRSLQEITRRLFEVEKQASDLLSELTVLRAGTLRIIVDSPHHLAKTLGKFRNTHPKVFIQLRSANTDEVISRLQNYDADIGVLGEVPTGQEFNIVKLSSTPIIAFASVEFARRIGNKLNFEEISKQPLILRERGSKTRRILESMAKTVGVKLKPVIEADGRETVREIVASGVGIGFVSLAEFGKDTRLAQVAFSGPQIHMDEALVCLKERRHNKLINAIMLMAESRNRGQNPTGR